MLGTILIVDDEKHTREGLRQSLEEEYDVYTASNIEEALNVLVRMMDEWIRNSPRTSPPAS